MTAALDNEFALAEYREMRSAVQSLVGIITATERFAVAGAATAAAFAVSGLTDDLVASRPLVSAIPFLVVSLAGLRCLTLYLVLRATLRYIESVENVILEAPALGFQRHFAMHGGPVTRAVELVSGGYWTLAVVASIAFWFLVN